MFAIPEADLGALREKAYFLSKGDKRNPPCSVTIHHHSYLTRDGKKREYRDPCRIKAEHEVFEIQD